MARVYLNDVSVRSLTFAYSHSVSNVRDKRERERERDFVIPSASQRTGIAARDEMMRPELKSPLPRPVHPGNLLFRIGVRHHDSPSGVPLKESREPLSRSVWLTENKNPAAIFFCSLPGDGNGVAGRWLNSVRASTDKRQTSPPLPPSSSSFVCFKRHLFGDLADGTARGFSRRGGSEKDERREFTGGRTRRIWGCMVRRGRI